MKKRKENEYRVYLTDELSQWLEQQKQATGKSYSQLINECVSQSANQDFQKIISQLEETHKLNTRIRNYVLSALDEVLIGNEVLNYLLNEERHTGDFEMNSSEHLIMKQARQKIRTKRKHEHETKLKAKHFNAKE